MGWRPTDSAKMEAKGIQGQGEASATWAKFSLSEAAPFLLSLGTTYLLN